VEDYDATRRLLVEVVGAYCAYCEAPVSVDMPVEHKGAKFDAANRQAARFFSIDNVKFLDTGFPDYATQWRNLLIACDSCNTIKSSQPGQQQAREYLYQFGTADAFETNNSEQLYMAALAWSIWPDSCPTNITGQPAPPVDQTYRLITFDYSSQSQADLANNGLLPPLSSTTDAAATTVYKKVWVIPNDDYIQTLDDMTEMHYRVLNMISMLKLNRYVEDASANDRRTQNRTNVYLLALNAVEDLATIVHSAGDKFDDPNVKLMVQSIRDTALATGYWCVWMWVFSTTFQDISHDVWDAVSTDDKNALLNYLFKIYMPGERANGDGKVLFPGTDLSRIPDLS
jgi:hypothetical protein